MLKFECFHFRLLYSGTASFDIRKMTPFYRADLHTALNVPPIQMAADPFLFVREETLYLFYELQRVNRKGCIAMICTKDLAQWSKPCVVLEEAFHLSFPFVFEDGGQVYMMPESGADRTVRLYQADDASLTHFSCRGVLLKEEAGSEISFADSSVIRQDGTYYLTTSVQRQGAYQLLLYTSESLFGPYRPHPMSPVVRGNRYGRCGGSPIRMDGKLYRIAQDCSDGYGSNVHALEIEELSGTSYRERLAFEAILSGCRCGGHQFSQVFFRGRYITAVDERSYHYFLKYRIFKKLQKLFR